LLFFLSLLALGRLALVLPSAADSAVEQAADGAFRRQDWGAAAAAYESLLREAPESAQYALRWGTSLHELGRHAEAVAALEKAAELGAPPVQVQYALGRAHGRRGDGDAAFAALARAAEAGAGPFGLLQRLASEPDFAPLRSDPRWGETVLAFDRNVRPCLYAPEFRQFDFWVGEWDVTPNGAPPGTLPSASSIQLILEGCVLLESWTSTGYAGKSFNLFEPATRRWRQVWVDTQGSMHLYQGEAREGNLYFTGESASAGGGKVLYQLAFLRHGRDGVRQLWEQSTDGGKTWSVAFDGIYRRKTGAAGAP
jgi:tetratricopeptide (TPR) repeat protein